MIFLWSGLKYVWLDRECEWEWSFYGKDYKIGKEVRYKGMVDFYFLFGYFWKFFIKNRGVGKSLIFLVDNEFYN